MKLTALVLLLLTSLPSIAQISEPQRILPLTPSLAEMSAEILESEWERIVGVTEYADFPSVIRKRPSIGSYARLQIERILSLKPDLVLVTSDGNPKDQVLKLKSLGLRVEVLDVFSLQDIPKTYRSLGRLLGRSQRGESIAQSFEARLSTLRPDLRGKRVFVQLGQHPLIGVGGGTFLGQAIEHIGYKNILRPEIGAYPRLQREFVIKSKPDAIVLLGFQPESTDAADSQAAWRALNVLQSQLVVVRGSELMRPTSRLLDGLIALKKSLERVP
jgi:ABC-type Fe3+-hydroxamate transport system substrate-binding protein